MWSEILHKSLVSSFGRVSDSSSDGSRFESYTGVKTDSSLARPKASVSKTDIEGSNPSYLTKNNHPDYQRLLTFAPILEKTSKKV